MKVLHVIGSMNPIYGGVAEGIRNSMPEIEKYNIYKEVVTLDSLEDEYLGTDNFIIHALGPCVTQWQYSRKLLPWLKSNFHRFDVIIVNGLWLYQGYAVLKCLKYLTRNVLRNSDHSISIPKVYIMPHGMLDPYFQKASHRKLKAIRNWLYWKLIEGKLINTVHGLLFTCETEKHLARKTFSPYHPKREYTVGYGIKDPPGNDKKFLKEFIRVCPDLINQSYFLFLSRIHEKKGIDLLIKAYNKLYEDFNFNMPKLVIAGPGLELLFGKKMIQLVQALKLKEQIYFPGMLTGASKWGAFYNCDAFILPSHQENFGIAVVEALACNKPVLISNQVNIWKEIELEGAGIVSEDSLTGTISLLENWLKLHDFEKKKMSLKARNVFEKYFTISAATKKIITALESN
jgi:glycosyltransferase involved in cell wall biosynthesis